ncbi:Lrp/AsnC family transcriptional regulator [Phytoactinopolyspora halotolerans]|uniref:AsnC family transcriptional regulator n=1 Tax=Phytoactinopolyspora halotolerans TaxID=1981512 RepID=A0A6L9S282_9ACTN|nr:AsnC family transcriptional regulator [Phytoactinopolyspora halotolerans]NED98671.1 AsnC family transcriptional regulator [Phytoactinopolyspora halotolerans]
MRMQDSNVIGELDLEITNALQLAPRVSWTDLGHVLNAEPTTLARRWQRLLDDGVARITVVPGRHTVTELLSAYVDLRCANGAVTEVARILTDHPEVLSIHHTAGSAQLMIVLSGGPRLPDYLLTRLGGIPGILEYAVHIVPDLLFETHRWHARALTADQQARLRELNAIGGTVSAGRRPRTEVDQQIIAKLCMNGRASQQELGAAVGLSAPAVARRLRRLLRDGVIRLRCDVARPRLGLPSAAFLRGMVDPRELSAAQQRLGDRVPELRLITALAGSSNAQLSVWLRSAADLFRVEERLNRELPSLTVKDRVLVLRTMKLMGHVFDDSQRYVRTVPLRIG